MKKVLDGAKQQELLIDKMKMVPPFKDLFPVDPQKVATIGEHMRVNGFDLSFPILLWDKAEKRGPHTLIILDGHTRIAAASEAHIMVVPVVRLKFKDQNEALAYSIHNQRDRRNLTDAVLLRCIEAVDKRKPQGARTDLASSGVKSGKSSEVTAKIVGTSPRKVEKVRSILRKGDQKTKQDVLDGKKFINAGYDDIRAKATPVIGAEPKAPEVPAHEEHFNGFVIKIYQSHGKRKPAEGDNVFSGTYRVTELNEMVLEVITHFGKMGFGDYIVEPPNLKPSKPENAALQ